MSAFSCGSRIPLPKQQVAPTNYHYEALGDPGLKTNAEYQYIYLKTPETIFSHLNATADRVSQALQQ